MAALDLAAHPMTLAHLEAVREDVLAASRAQACELHPRKSLAQGTFEAVHCELAPPHSMVKRWTMWCAGTARPADRPGE